MNDAYTIIGNLQIIFQFIVWSVSFYWLDFELFIYILNDYYYLKVLLGIILLLNQIFLFQYLYCLLKIDSIYEKENNFELQNINEKQDYTTCKKCNISRPKRAHHCSYCNKCILKMDHHCFILNKCIGQYNYSYFIRYIIMIELNSLLIFLISLYVFFYYYNEIKLVGIIKYGLLIFASFMISCGLLFYLLFQIYLKISDLTTLEFIYPSLRIKKKN